MTQRPSLETVAITVLACVLTVLAGQLFRSTQRQLDPCKGATMQLKLNPHDALTIGIDCSGSMNTRDCADGMTRMEYARKRALALIALAELQGIAVDVIGFGTTLRPMYALDLATAEQRFPVELAANESGTNTGAMAKAAMQRLDQIDNEHMTLVIFTDGGATDNDLMLEVVVENERRNIAMRICSFSVGQVDLGRTHDLGSPQALEDWEISSPQALEDWEISFALAPRMEHLKHGETTKINGPFDVVNSMQPDAAPEPMPAAEPDVLPEPIPEGFPLSAEPLEAEASPVAEARAALAEAPSKTHKKGKRR